MRFKRTLAAAAAAVILMPAAASAATQLSDSAKQQVADLALQLVGILTALNQAQAQGSAYTSSPVFQTQAAAWSTQISQIGQQLVTVLSSAVSVPVTPNIIPTMGQSSTDTCPDFTRNLSLGMQGGDVAQLQLFLAKDPYGKFLEGVNGYFDQATQDAVQRYQSAHQIVSGGTPSATGYGNVGPGTRASISAVCNRGSYVVSVPTITVPATGNNGIVTPPPAPPPAPVTHYSTGQLSILPGSLGTSGGPNSISFSINLLPNAACTASSFTLSFGDGQTQSLTSDASCGNQIQIITHVYAQPGRYTATLTSGSFSVILPVHIEQPDDTVTLSVADAGTSLTGAVTLVYDPGATCASATYALSFGDGVTQNISFTPDTGNCIKQTQIVNHTFPKATQYLITAADSSGHTVAAQFTPVTH